MSINLSQIRLKASLNKSSLLFMQLCSVEFLWRRSRHLRNPAKHMFLLNMLIVGLVETGPDMFQLQLLTETGEVVEYTLSKNDRNLSVLFNNKNYK